MMQTHKNPKKIVEFTEQYLPKHYIKLVCAELDLEYTDSIKTQISRVKKGKEYNYKINQAIIKIAKKQKKQIELLEQSIEK